MVAPFISMVLVEMMEIVVKRDQYDSRDYE